MNNRFRNRKQARRYLRDSQDRLPFENGYQRDRRLRELSEREQQQRKREERFRKAA